ncbi:hypothetical protein BCR35DRAFT_297677 [Leucosporidium creatinivorum]|uniref:t-SNARE coiled-coil homology domain-containing protein n=1 Tax=Leucosporidium creatinivorum TaxID=106004 RepID=A0A1Y2BZ09_9BASI|nr:hypothetical protein BCR35DRAFT_297677 [Leucosporidium creatinivorum]
MAPVVSRIQELKEAIKAKEARYPPNKRVKFGRQRLSPTSPAPPEDQWTKQAEQVATNLRSFSNFLASIRRAYLDLGASSSSHQTTQPRTIDTSKGLAAWEGVRWLSDRERDEIDFGVKVALRKSVDRVRELEAVEKARVIHENRVNPNAGLTRFLGLPVPSSNRASAAIASHRTYVTLYLNTLLAQVSKHQRDQQEARVKRQLEKSATLGGLGGGGALGMDEFGKALAVKAKAEHAANKGKGKEEGQVGQVPSIYRPNPATAMDDDDNEDGEPLVLTQDQIQQFEAEESALLKATQTDLASLKQAESSLLEIASLQSQLAMHLTQQSELTDKLWEEAVGVTGKVDEGNTQLKKARERNRESRVVLLIFLLLSSATILFLDYYS